LIGSLAAYEVPGEAQVCPACGSRRLELFEPLAVRRRLAGRRVGFVTGCRTCGLVFANPLPTRDELAAFYSPDGEWGRARTEEEQRRHGPQREYVRLLLEPVRHLVDPAAPPRGGAVFEFGCGDGKLLDAFQDFGWDTYGLDPGNKRAFVRHRELHSVPAEPRFGIAILHQVLEHLDAPLDVLRAIHAALEPNGLLIVSVPRLDTLPRHRDYRYCINPRNHILCYSRDCLATLLAFAGFESIDASPPADADTTDWLTLRRLRMIGRKMEQAVAAPPAPLAAARRAFAAYHATDPARRRWRTKLPVRMRAALAEWRRASPVS
jgi:SAM-dependent methyltransferase